MTFSEILSAELVAQRQYALVFSVELAQAIAGKWQQYGTTNCVPVPVLLTDGRYMLCADVLSEVRSGGLLHQMWINSDLPAIQSSTEIMSWQAAVALMPLPPAE